MIFEYLFYFYYAVAGPDNAHKLKRVKPALNISITMVAIRASLAELNFLWGSQLTAILFKTYAEEKNPIVKIVACRP